MNTVRRIFMGALALVGLLVIFLVEEYFRGEWTLEHWKAQMAATGGEV